jgi:hypothetical protein
VAESELRLKKVMRPNEKIPRRKQSPEKIFTISSCALPYVHEQHDPPLPSGRVSERHWHSRIADRVVRLCRLTPKDASREAGLILGPVKDFVGQTTGE